MPTAKLPKLAALGVEYQRRFGHMAPRYLLRRPAELERLYEKALRDNKPVPGWVEILQWEREMQEKGIIVD